MIRTQVAPHRATLRPLRVAASLAMVILTFGAMVVLPTQIEAHYATPRAARVVVEVIGPMRLGPSTTPLGNRTPRRAEDAARASVAPDRTLLERIAARSRRTSESHMSSGAVD